MAPRSCNFIYQFQVILLFSIMKDDLVLASSKAFPASIVRPGIKVL